jgi:hypothetical protein
MVFLRKAMSASAMLVLDDPGIVGGLCPQLKLRAAEICHLSGMVGFNSSFDNAPESLQ